MKRFIKSKKLKSSLYKSLLVARHSRFKDNPALILWHRQFYNWMNKFAVDEKHLIKVFMFDPKFGFKPIKRIKKPILFTS